MKTFEISDDLIAFAHALADASGEVAMRYFRRGTPVETKKDASPVTIADKEAENAIRRLIEQRFPGHGIIGEEHERLEARSEFVWVIDPIDGTKSFITGRPLFGTLIALTRENVPVLGVIDHPALRERWIGAAGRPTLFNGEQVEVRSCGALSLASLLTSSPHYYKGADLERFETVRQASRYCLYGTECMAYGLLASGHVDIVTEAGMDIFDYLAAVPVVTGAGGRMTDWQDRPLGLSSGDKVLATGDGRLHEAALAILGGRS